MTLRYFLSGASGIAPPLLPDVAALVDFRLLSMHKAFKGNTKVWCEVVHHPKSAVREVMLDSGAFTAFTKGHKVVLDELVTAYNDVVRRMKGSSVKEIWFINLDVIPGAWGRVAEPDEIRRALDESDENYKILSRKFSRERVLPVFHQTEDQNRLEEIVDMSGGFVAFGFRQDFSEEHRITQAQKVIHDSRIRKEVQIHGLATTGYKMLARAPFDTVDSATWLYIAAMGAISYVDERGTLKAIAISKESPMQRDWGFHFNTLTDLEKELILSRLEEAGVTFAQVNGQDKIAGLSYRILFNAHQMKFWLSNHYPRLRNAALAAPIEHGLFDL